MSQGVEHHLMEDFLRIGWTNEELDYHKWRKGKSAAANEAYIIRLFQTKKQLERSGILGCKATAKQFSTTCQPRSST